MLNKSNQFICIAFDFANWIFYLNQQNAFNIPDSNAFVVFGEKTNHFDLMSSLIKNHAANEG